MKRRGVLAFAVLSWTLSSMAQTAAQKAHENGGDTSLIEVAITYSNTHINAPPGGCGCFWMNGGKADVNTMLYRRLSVVVELSGQHAHDINSAHEDLGLVTFLVGPRYSYRSQSRFTPFAQALAGGVHGFDGLFPAKNGTTSARDAFALSAGGGLDINLSRRIAIRAFQADYLLTRLPNDAGDHENSFRISAGVVFKLSRR